nr:hypothetical protein KK1_010382 [Cajanus cajan]
MEAVKLIEEGCVRNHPCYELVQDIKVLTLRLTAFSCYYITREANIVADRLAKNRAGREEGPSVYESPPKFLLSLLAIDRVGII